MRETSKCYRKRLQRGDFKQYLKGIGIDIGCGDDPLQSPEACGLATWDLKDGDAQLLNGVDDNKYDFVYSSHCLEHLCSVEESLKNWVRILKPGGALYVVVPDYVLYEKMHWPSLYNGDHKQTFSLYLPRERVGRFNHYHIGINVAPLLEELGVTVERAEEEDDGFDYNNGPVDQTLSIALSQICFIGRKHA